MRSRVGLAIASVIASFGFSCVALAAQFATGQSAAVPLHHSSHICFTRDLQAGAVRARAGLTCQDAAASEAAPARQPDLPAFPVAADKSRPSRRSPLRAATGEADPNRHAVSKRQPGNNGRSVGFKFAAGMGTPEDRLSLEGGLSPYQQPNGNTSAAMSSSLTNKIEAQGMHFGFELQY
jgi:hypothetical protein